MPINTILGVGGSGKTVIGVYFLSKFPELKKYGNFDIKLPNYEKKNIVELFELNPDRNEKVIVIFDEGYTDFDNRMSMSDESIFNTSLLFQARKNNMSILGITQLHILDIRWRSLEKYRIYAHERPIYDKNGDDYKGDFHYTILDAVNGKNAKFTLSYRIAKSLFSLFETKYKIFPRDYDRMKLKIECRDPKKRNKIINEMVKKIIKKCDIPELKREITHDWISNAMLDCELDLSFERFIYIRLRNRKD